MPVHAKLLQSCLTLCDPMDCSPWGSSIPGILQARTLKGVARPTFKLWEKLHFGGSALCRKVTCPVPPLAWRDWPFGADPLSSASGELIRCHVPTAGCSVAPGPAGFLEEQNTSYNWTVYLVLPPTPRPRPPRHSSLVRWDLFNDLF